MKKLIWVWLCLLLCCRAADAQNLVEIKPYTRIGSNDALEVLLLFDIASEWHIFAPYEQAFGAPLKLKWRLPAGTTIAEEEFSQTQNFEQEGLYYDGYEDKAFYRATLHHIDNHKKFTADINWQVCKDECIPESIRLEVPVIDMPDFIKKLQEAEFDEYNHLPQSNWILILLAAFGGGLILNLMPCVFPILSIKIITLAQLQARTRRQEALFYMTGVIASMMLIAIILSLVRQFDPSASWGFQLQSPWFVGAMLILFVVLTLMMLDIISVNNALFNRLIAAKFNRPEINAFMTGFLAVLVASPCTAPLMGAAVGYALMSPIYTGFPIFLALGIGYALPFVLLALFPKTLSKILPRPGIWMLRLKKILSIPLILTCFWLMWILASQLNLLNDGKNLQWQNYSATAVAAALEQKRPVFIDFTAKWCITCMVNKKAALQSDLMAKKVKSMNILLLRADMTKANPDAAAGLAYFGRAGVPLYVYYDGKSADYLILPQILTPNILQEYLR